MSCCWSFYLCFSLQWRSVRGKKKVLPTNRSLCLCISTEVKEIDYLFPEELNSLCITLLWRAVLNLLSHRNSARYIGVHFVPGKVLQSVLRFNIAQSSFSQFLPHGKRIGYSESFIFEWTEGFVQFYLIPKTRYELQIKDYSFLWARLQSCTEMAAGVHVWGRFVFYWKGQLLPIIIKGSGLF